MITTNKILFDSVVKKYATKTGIPHAMHEDVYLDDNDNVVASMESSSWGAPTIYKVAKSFGSGNEGVINFVAGIIENKQK